MYSIIMYDVNCVTVCSGPFPQISSFYNPLIGQRLITLLTTLTTSGVTNESRCRAITDAVMRLD